MFVTKNKYNQTVVAMRNETDFIRGQRDEAENALRDCAKKRDALERDIRVMKNTATAARDIIKDVHRGIMTRAEKENIISLLDKIVEGPSK